MDPAAIATPLPDLVLWRGDGCHLCDDARALVADLLAERAAAGLRTPTLIDRRIAEEPAVERELFEQVPVLELAGRRLPLALRAGLIRAFLAGALDGPGIADGGEAASGLDRLAGRGP